MATDDEEDDSATPSSAAPASGGGPTPVPIGSTQMPTEAASVPSPTTLPAPALAVDSILAARRGERDAYAGYDEDPVVA